MRLKREKTHKITEYLKTKGPQKTKDNMIQQVIKDQVRSDYSSNIYKLLCFQLLSLNLKSQVAQRTLKSIFQCRFREFDELTFCIYM